MGGKSSTISTSSPMAGNLRIQTAVYGSVIPLVYGRTRISGNLLWYGGFTPIAHTTTTESGAGGKGGGGVKTQDTKYTYQAAVLMGLCEGAISTVLRSWRGKAMYSLVQSSVVLQQKSMKVLVPVGGVVTAVGGFTNDVSVVCENLTDPIGNYSWGPESS